MRKGHELLPAHGLFAVSSDGPALPVDRGLSDGLPRGLVLAASRQPAIFSEKVLHQQHQQDAQSEPVQEREKAQHDTVPGTAGLNELRVQGQQSDAEKSATARRLIVSLVLCVLMPRIVLKRSRHVNTPLRVISGYYRKKLEIFTHSSRYKTFRSEVQAAQRVALTGTVVRQ